MRPLTLPPFFLQKGIGQEVKSFPWSPSRESCRWMLQDWALKLIGGGGGGGGSRAGEDWPGPGGKIGADVGQREA